jgi:peroxiredoxin
LTKLEGADTQVLGVSMDSPFANYEFAKQNGVAFPLLGDWTRQATKDYGLLETKEVQGIPMELGRRATFLIGKDGKILETSVDSEAVDPSKIVAACERRKMKE